MTHTAEYDIQERILKTDIAVLNDHNVSDHILSLLAAEHAARCEALSKIIDPTMGRALLLMIAGALMGAAEQIENATTPGSEIVYA